MSDENQNDENQNEENQNEENQSEDTSNQENDNEGGQDEGGQDEGGQDEGGQDEGGQDEGGQDEGGQDEETNNQENDSAKHDADDAPKNVEDQTKETVSEIKEGWNEATKSGENKKLLAGILGIVVGGLGVHKFILGYNKEGIIMLVIGVVGWFLCAIPTGIVCLVGLIEGIIYLTKSDEEFYETYQANKKPWF